jgi:Tol biopolymer transport system component
VVAHARRYGCRSPPRRPLAGARRTSYFLTLGRRTTVQLSFVSGGRLETAATVEQLNSSLTGRYLIEREIGRGGMATVYLARDLRHDRRVALKLLLAELGAILGPERFLSEIRVTANLQHPNLLPLFDSGEADGRLFYVMPFVDGESLRHRLDREKQLPIDEALRIAGACASALDYAHRNQVVHRDLKPENILLSAGQPVIADFGIALAVSNAGGARITQSGLSLGTPQYMSPEQAAGDRDVDGRSDIYSLACVLYEMLTGDPPHTGSTVQAVIAKVLVEKPRSARSQRERIPEHVDAAIERALAKIPADRWATAGEFGQALVDASMTSAARAMSASGTSPMSHAQRTGAAGTIRRFLWPAIAGTAVIVAAAAWWKLASRPADKPITFVEALPPNAKLAIEPSQVAFAPDGSSIVYSAIVGGSRRLYIRPLASSSARELPGTDDAILPFFSPDSRWVAFATEAGVLFKVPVRGGPPVQIGRTPAWRGGAWSPGGDILLGSDSGLYRISAAGGPVELLTKRDIAKGEQGHVQPMFLPDGRTFAFRVEAATSRAGDQLATGSLDEKGYQLLGVRGANPLGFFGGKLLYGRLGGLIAAIPFDARRRKTSGEPTIILEEVSVYAGAAASFAADGSLVYVKSKNASRLILTDEHAVSTREGGPARRYTRPRFSPDGRRVALQVSSAGTNRFDIWLYDLKSEVLSRLTSQSTSQAPEWTADGTRVVYVRDGEVWQVPADGSGPEERVFGSRLPVRDIALSPDGKLAVFRVEDPRTRSDLWLLPLEGETAQRKPSPLLTSTFNEQGARISPDGRWLTYVSDESGRYEVYVRPFPGLGPRVQISANGGAEPVWTANGSRIIYRAADKFIAASVSLSSEITVTTRQQLFEDEYQSSLFRSSYDVDRTGKTFVLIKPVDKPEIVVMMNGLDALLAAASDKR